MRWRPRPGFFLRLAVFACLWWIITQGEPGSWWWGLPVLLLVAWMTPVLPSQNQRWRWRLWPFLKLLPRFLLLSARGGWEVAVLALSPRSRLNTRLVDYTWCCLPDGPAQIFMACLINLIPGTLTLRSLPDQDCLHLHILNYRPSTLLVLRRLEVAIADLYGFEVSPNLRKSI